VRKHYLSCLRLFFGFTTRRRTSACSNSSNSNHHSSMPMPTELHPLQHPALPLLLLPHPSPGVPLRRWRDRVRLHMAASSTSIRCMINIVKMCHFWNELGANVMELLRTYVLMVVVCQSCLSCVSCVIFIFRTNDLSFAVQFVTVVSIVTSCVCASVKLRIFQRHPCYYFLCFCHI